MELAHIATAFLNIFKPETRQSELEKYLASKNPQTAADVEHYVQKFNREVGGQSMWWSR